MSKKAIPKPSAPTHTDEEFAELWDRLDSTLTFLYNNPHIPLAVDTETTGFRTKDGRDYCIGISLAYEDLRKNVVGLYYPINHPTGDNVSQETLEKLAYVLENHRELIFQNAKFDLASLETIGIHCEQFFYDTVVISQLLDENTPIRKDLDSLALHYLKEPGKVKDDFVEYEKKNGNQNITWQQMWDYAVMDAVSTYKVAQVLVTKMYESDEEALPEVWGYKEKFTRVLLAMEKLGVRVDTELAKEMAVKGRAEMERIKKELGLNPGSRNDLEKLLIDELGLPVVKRSEKTGAPSFDKTAMAKYEVLLDRMENPIAKLIKAYRGWQKATTSSFEPYVELVSPDGRIRCNYNMDTARTGRLSSSSPNLQQVPKEGDQPWNEHTKSCFIPEDGYVLVNADYSQLELRLGTAYAGEPHLKEVFDEGRDIFTEMAERLGFDRQTTKTFVYSTQYGAGKNRIMEAFGVSENKAIDMLDNYYSTYPLFKQFSNRCSTTAEQKMKVKLWSGRYRHFKYRSDSYKAMNSVIQGGSADIVERVMIRLYDEIHSDDCRMLMQVHDAVVFEIKEELVDDYLPIIKEIMEDVSTAVGHSDFDVKFAVDIGPDYGSKGWGVQE